MEYTSPLQIRQEEQLYDAWLAHSRNGTELSSPGHRLRILNSGWLNRQCGPDFNDCEFELDGVRYRGQVEMHRRAEEWYSHGHHLDSAYRNVQLHVLAAGSPEKHVFHSASRRHIPAFAMAMPKTAGRAVCRPPARIDSSAQAARMKRLALQRLDLRLRFQRAALQHTGEAQFFYEQTLAALGFPSNTSAFKALARAVPRFLIEHPGEIEDYLALYAGQAGLLGQNKALRHRYQRFNPFLNHAALGREQWQLAAQRPHNHPLRRIASWALWLSRYGFRAFKQHICNIMEQRRSFPATFKEVHGLLALSLPASLLEASVISPKMAAYKAIGRVRLSELLANVFIPFLIVRAGQRGSRGFETFLREFYLWLPGNPGYALLKQFAPWAAAYNKSYPRFFAGQALLHLQRQYCSNGGCKECPLKHTVLQD